jgi:dCMP deaminase
MIRDQYWLDICNAIAANSKCLSRKLGAVIVKNNGFIIATGYNGPPAKCKHCDDINYRSHLAYIYHNPSYYNFSIKVNERLDICPRQVMGFKSGEGLEYCQASHAERNAISIAARLGHSTDGCSMYLNWIIPCFECMKSIINAGIKEIVVTKLEDYEKSGLTGRLLAEEAGIKLREYNL